MEKKLITIGKYIAGILLVILLIQFLFIWFVDCKNVQVQDKNFNLDQCMNGLVSLIIPTEVSIINIFGSAPAILLIIILILYWRYVKPHEK